MSSEEANLCKERADASTQALKAYYKQPRATQYNLNEALDVLVTLTDRSQKRVHAEQQKKFLELIHKPSLTLYMGCPEQILPDEIKNQRLQPFLPLPRINPDPPKGGEEIQSSKQETKGTQSGPKGLPSKEGEPTSTKDQEDPGTFEPLNFFKELYNIEENLPNVFNKLNDEHYINGIVNLSSHTLTKSETSVLSKGLGFCPTPGAPDIGNIIQDLDVFKRKTKLNLFFSESNQDPPEQNSQSGVPFEHKSFKFKSTFNPVGPFQLETMFHSIDQDLYKLKYRQPRKKKLSKEEYKAIKSLRNNPDIIMKPADKGGAIGILDKQFYINEGERQLHSNQFYEETVTDLTGDVIYKVNLHVNNMLQGGQISQNTSNYLTIDINRTQQFYHLPKIYKDLHIHQEDL